jgi:hypothetical protein
MPPRLWLPPGSTAAVTSRATAAVSLNNTTSNSNKHLTHRVTRSEALSLYREILRTAKHFHWKDPVSGQPYNKMLQQQARREFQEALEETDPLIVARLLVTGRDCVQQIHNKFNAATQAAWKRIETDNQDSSRRK